MFKKIQRRLIFPGSWLPYSQNSFPEGGFLRKINSKTGKKISILTGKAVPTVQMVKNASNFESLGHLIYFYGNGMTLRQTDEPFYFFRALGLDVTIPDYLGYGDSEGETSEEGCHETALAVLDHVIQNMGGRTEKIIIAGWSLGAAVAINLVACRKVAGLVVLSPFTSIADMMRKTVRLPLPFEIIASDQFNNRDTIRQIKCPILIAHGTNDAVVPYKMGQEIAKSLSQSVRFMSVKGAGHNDMFSYGDLALHEEMRTFLSTVLS